MGSSAERQKHPSVDPAKPDGGRSKSGEPGSLPAGTWPSRDSRHLAKEAKRSSGGGGGGGGGRHSVKVYREKVRKPLDAHVFGPGTISPSSSVDSKSVDSVSDTDDTPSHSSVSDFDSDVSSSRSSVISVPVSPRDRPPAEPPPEEVPGPTLEAHPPRQAYRARSTSLNEISTTFPADGRLRKLRADSEPRPHRRSPKKEPVSGQGDPTQSASSKDTDGRPLSARSTRVKLEVGGEHFAVSLGHFTRVPGSYFAAMFADPTTTPPTQQADGTHFIDRDPFVFRHVLNYLRGDELDFADLSEMERKALLRDAEFYRLPEIKAAVENLGAVT